MSRSAKSPAHDGAAAAGAARCGACGATPPAECGPLASCPECGELFDAPRARYCRGCRYDLAGIDWAPASCPECGRVFDPDDPGTTLAPGERSAFSVGVQRYGLPLAAALLLLTAAVHTIIPRPANLHDWRLWLWMGSKYGVQERWSQGGRAVLYWWGGRLTEVRKVDRAGAPVWEVRWTWPDQWRIQAHAPGVPWRSLSSAFNDMKRDMFGVSIGASTADTNDAPFIVEGSKVDVFSHLVAKFGIQVSPFLLRENQEHVWVFDAGLQRMVAVHKATAQDLGYEVRLWRGDAEGIELISPGEDGVRATATEAPPPAPAVVP